MKTVQQLQDEIQENLKLIKDIQDACDHSSGHDVVMFSWRPGCYNPVRMCKLCRAVLPGITQEESNKLHEENMNTFRETLKK